MARMRLLAMVGVMCVVLTSLTACNLPWASTPTPSSGPAWGFPYQPGTSVTLGCLGLHDDNIYADSGYSLKNAHPLGLAGAPAFKCPPDVLSATTDPTKANEASLDLIASNVGVPIVPLAAGKVLVADESCHFVVVDHGSNTWVAYLHIDVAVKVGDSVTTTTIIGHTAAPPVKSSCGEVSTTPHVHFAFMIDSDRTGTYVPMVGKVLCGYRVVKDATYPYGALQEVAAPHRVIAPNDSFTIPQDCPTVGTTSSNPQTPPLNRTLQVSATQEWQSTDISVTAGATVIILYLSGQWTIFQGVDPLTDGNGQVGRPETCRLMPQANLGSLIGRVGTGAPFFVGNGVAIVSSEAGDLQLSMNDCVGAFDDNGGALTVNVVVSH